MFSLIETMVIGDLLGNFIIYILSSVIFIFILNQIFAVTKIKKIK